MKKYIILLCSLLLSFGCNKETTKPTYSYGRLQIAYKEFVGTYPVIIYLDNEPVDSIEQNGGLVKVMPLKDSITLKVTKMENDSLLFTYKFHPGEDTRMQLFISDVLGIAQLYTPPTTQPAPDHMRVQLFHKLTVNGVKYPKVNMKIFRRDDWWAHYPTYFEPTPYELKNVEFGKLSDPVELPILGPDEVDWTGQPQFYYHYYVELYDAATGELVLGLNNDYQEGMIQMMQGAGGKSYIVDVQTADFPPYGAFFGWMPFYQL